jgi:antitoxin HigA-1
MLSADEKERLERDFAEAEASVRLEGLTPSANFYAVKARVLAGQISFEQGRNEILAFHGTKSSAVA